MSHTKSKSRKDSTNVLAKMGANMSAMLSGTYPLTDMQSDNAEGAEIGAIEMPQSLAPANPPVTNPTPEAPVQSAKSVEGNGVLKRHPFQ